MIAGCTQRLLKSQASSKTERRLNLHTLLLLTTNFTRRYYLTYTGHPELWHVISNKINHNRQTFIKESNVQSKGAVFELLKFYIKASTLVEFTDPNEEVMFAKACNALIHIADSCFLDRLESKSSIEL